MIKSRRAFGAAWVLGAALLMTGCATDRQLDARFAAGWRPDKGECAWGGETPTLEAYCAELNASDDSPEALFRAFDEKLMALQKAGTSGK